MKKILITGGEGFIGRHLQEAFAARPDFTLLLPGQGELDLTDSAAVAACLESFQPDVIVHSATSNTLGKDYANDVCEQNLRMFFNLLRYRPAGCMLYTLCSGSSYNRENWVDNMREDYLGEHIPTDGQGFSKFVIASHARHLEDVATLRLFGIFGRHEDHRYKLISNTIAKRLAGFDVALFRNAIYHYLDVEDFCRILLRLIDENVRHGEFNITPDRAVSLEEVVLTVDRVLGIKTPYSVLNPGLGRPCTGDNQRLRAALPGLEFTPFETSVAHLAEHYRQHPERIDRAALEQDQLLSHARNINRS